MTDSFVVDSLSERVQQKLTSLIRTDVQAMSAYVVPPSEGLLKLDAMENPFNWPGGLPDVVQQEWLSCLQSVSVNRYPDPRSDEVKQQLKAVFDLPEGSDILLGNGSDEIIQLLIQAVANDKTTVMAPEPGFVMYKVLADINRVNFSSVALTDDFALDMPAMLAAIKLERPELIFLACPNNPTGNCWPLSDIETLVQAADGLVVVDEAYSAFTDQSAVGLLSEYPNVVVMRTLSKIGLAGLRLGYLVAAPEWIYELDKIRMPYNINVLTQVSAAFALKHFALLKQQTDYLKQQRENLTVVLREIKDLQVFQSQANFLLLRTDPEKTDVIFNQLKQQGILIKNLNTGHPLLRGCLRVTVSTEQENQQFVDTLKIIMQS